MQRTAQDGLTAGKEGVVPAGARNSTQPPGEGALLEAGVTPPNLGWPGPVRGCCPWGRSAALPATNVPSCQRGVCRAALRRRGWHESWHVRGRSVGAPSSVSSPLLAEASGTGTARH